MFRDLQPQMIARFGYRVLQSVAFSAIRANDAVLRLRIGRADKGAMAMGASDPLDILWHLRTPSWRGDLYRSGGVQLASSGEKGAARSVRNFIPLRPRAQMIMRWTLRSEAVLRSE